ncbi:MAG: peptidase [Devosiaceae bacterium]|nr:peptidase [Devosiaceae bacterium]
MNITKTNWLLAIAFAAALTLTPAKAQQNSDSSAQTEEVTIVDVVNNYADIGLATFQDSLRTAEQLRTAIEDLLNDPNDETLELAQEAWRTARIPFEISEIYVQANPIVGDWVNRVNAWPIDPDYIDYPGSGAPSADNNSASENIIGSTTITLGGNTIDVEKITTELISQNLHLPNGDQTKIASGYQVIEFLLWGNDTLGAEEKDVEDGAGKRPATDFDLETCTNQNCERRGEYLYAAVNLLIEDLQEMVGNWLATGQARRALLADPDMGLSMMISGMGSLALGELAGNRLMRSINVGDQTGEQDRFSNNTNISYLFNARGLIGVYFGEYFTMEDDYIAGASMADILEKTNPELDEEFRIALGLTMARMRLMVEYARDVEAYDLMIAPGNEEGNGLILEAVASLIDLTQVIEKFPAAFGVDPIEFIGSAELDNFVPSTE